MDVRHQLTIHYLSFLVIALFLSKGYSKFSTSELIAEVKQLQNLAYQLGLEEAKEMTRGKYLNILTRKKVL